MAYPELRLFQQPLVQYNHATIFHSQNLSISVANPICFYQIVQRFPPVSATDNGTDRQNNNIDQLMAFMPLYSWVFER